jgi:hypothetical protein
LKASSEGLAEFHSKIAGPTLANEDAGLKDHGAVLAILKTAAKSESDSSALRFHHFLLAMSLSARLDAQRRSGEDLFHASSTMP